ncbi:hypothetical protein Bca52824_047166 [Brassica carinata]|uniref:CDT1 Geminin-binding domain-containing protein n=1 Tax=Brassica carinata TaxID=52824 RepID=A0A8X7RGV0_BRACI|nr:hypothetical protein Bca52824_047166 [Brassica carinata]
MVDRGLDEYLQVSLSDVGFDGDGLADASVNSDILISFVEVQEGGGAAVFPVLGQGSFRGTTSTELDEYSKNHVSLPRPRDSDKPVKRQILTSPRKPETTLKLPEWFEILDECFNGLVTAIRLLKLKGSLTSIANICPKIEYLTNLIFSYDHLAQMKHIYPEAIEVKRVLNCMKPTRHINLNTDATELEDTSCGTKYMQLRTVFYSKLVDFYKAHPKDEIPKELLPEPFNFSKKDSDTISVVDVE